MTAYELTELEHWAQREMSRARRELGVGYLTHPQSLEVSESTRIPELVMKLIAEQKRKPCN